MAERIFKTDPAAIKLLAEKIKSGYGQALTLPNGQSISPQDPNYKTYAAQMGMASSAGSKDPIASSTASSASGISTQTFGTKLMDMLKKYQNIEKAPFLGQTYNAQEEQANRVSQTPSNLIGASPSIQAGARSANVNAMNPTISGLEQAGQTFTSQLNTFQDILGQAQNIQKLIQDNEQTAVKNSQTLVETAIGAGSDAISALIESQPDLVKKAGYDAKTLTGIAKALKAKEDLEARKITSATTPEIKLVDIGGTKYEYNPVTGEYTAPKVPTLPPAQKVEQANKIIGDIDALLKSPYLNQAIGPIQSQWPQILRGGERNAVDASIDNLIASLAIENLSLLKGPMSDKDIQFIKEASSKLKKNVSESAFRNELESLKAKFVEIKNKASGNATGEVLELNGVQYIDDGTGNFVPKGNGGAGNAVSAKKLTSAIGQYESGGNYQAKGPITKNGDRAYGKYQVMGNNIPSWTKAILGVSMTPQQFLNDQKAQDKVAEAKLGQYLEKYGTYEDAASMWFSGRPVAKAGNSKDVLGTTVNSYVSSVINYLKKNA